MLYFGDDSLPLLLNDFKEVKSSIYTDYLFEEEIKRKAIEGKAKASSNLFSHKVDANEIFLEKFAGLSKLYETNT